MGLPNSLEDTPPRCTPHCAEAGKLGSAVKPRASCEHLLRTPATNTWPGLASATVLEVTPSSSRGYKPRLRPIARESVRLRFELRRLEDLLGCVQKGGERKHPEWFGLEGVGIECGTWWFIWISSSLVCFCLLTPSRVSGARRSPTWFLECYCTAALS